MARRKLDDMQESVWSKIHADFLWNEIEWQGECLIWRIRKKYHMPEDMKTRGSIKGFSRASRLRLMKTFARLSWEKNMPYLFLTLTYPDETRLRDRWQELTPKQKMDEDRYKEIEYLRMTQHRWVFWRFLENYLGEHVAGIWRLEFKPRLTGVFKGKAMPHLHILLCKCKYIPWQEIQWMWQNTIGERFVNTDIRAAYDVEVVMHYLSKYLGKDELHSLEDDAYLDSIPAGRSWGVMRKKLLIQDEKFMAKYFESDDIASLRHYACPEKVELIDTGMCSFTLLGPKAVEIGEMVFGVPEGNRKGKALDTEKKIR